MPRLAAAAASIALAAASLFIAAGCGDDGGAAPAGGSHDNSTAPAGGAGGAPRRPARPARPALCGRLRTSTLGRIRDPAMDELSGLSAGRAHPGVLYAHEDSGSPAVLTTLRRDGTVIGHPVVSGAQQVDWEDIAARRTPGRGAELFIGDIGDNDAERASVQVYRVPEPSPAAPATAAAAALALRYPDGAHDAEALLADPLRDELVIVTKGVFTGRAYAVRATTAPGVLTTLRRGPLIPFGPVTAGDVSADGRTVALRSYDRLVVWRRHGREPLLRTLARAPCTSDVSFGDEEQGEALTLVAGGRAVITSSEGELPRLRRRAPHGG